MKRIMLGFMVLVALLLVCCSEKSHASSFFEDVSKLVSDKAKEAMPVGLFGIGVKPSASLYLPIWKFHAYDNPKVEYFNAGIGGEWNKDLRGGEAYIGGMFNAVSLSTKFWDFDWAKHHVERSKLPDIFLGPSLMFPFDAKEIVKTFSSMDEFLKRGRLMAGVRF